MCIGCLPPLVRQARSLGAHHYCRSLCHRTVVVQAGVLKLRRKYPDSFGFKELPEFIKPENYLKAAEMSMEDDYGMLDGIINNGPREEKRSVLEQLKEKAAETPAPFPAKKDERELV